VDRCERFWNWTKAQAIEQQPPKIPEKGRDLGMHGASQEDKDEYEPDLEEPKPNVPSATRRKATGADHKKNPSPMFLANWKWFLTTHLVPIIRLFGDDAADI